MTKAGSYIHIPFCRHTCNYCDYYTTEKREADLPQFVEMLIREIKLIAEDFSHNWQFDSIYLGGGSPALLPPRELETILNKLKEYFSLSQIPEITLEINPGENSFEDLKSFKEMGVNRLSIGFQSLNPKFLNLLTRTHKRVIVLLFMKMSGKPDLIISALICFTIFPINLLKAG